MSIINWNLRAKEVDLRVRNFINGEFVDCHGDQLITKLAPRDGSLLYQFPAGTNEDVDQAVACAKQAFDDGRWQGKTIHERKAILTALWNLIDKNREELALLDCLDVGKPITYALHMDIPHALSFLKSAIDHADKLQSACGQDGSWFAYQQRKPVGVVGAILGWNFPLSMAVLKMGPALAMGNSLVIKPSEFSSLSTRRLAALAVEAGVPPGVFNVVHGAGTTVGAALAHHPAINLLSFTGSTATGKQMMIAAGKSNMKRLMLECGGKSPYIVFDDCPDDLDYVARDVVESITYNQGEVCVAGSRLLVQASIKDKLLPKILEHIAQIKPGDPLNAETSFGALINEAQMNKVLGYIESGKQDAKLIFGGHRVSVDVGNTENQGYYVEPTIFDLVEPEHKIAQEEIFGPVLSILTFKDEEEAIKMANSTCYGLAAYVATQNVGRAQRMGQRLNTGYLQILSSSKPSRGGVEISQEPQCQSGFGSEIGIGALMSYSVSTAVHLKT